MNDLQPHQHGEEGTHSVCDQHNIGGKSVCCECTGKIDCTSQPQENYNHSHQFWHDRNPEGCLTCGKTEMELFLAKEHEKIKSDLLSIADKGEYEDMRREIENYFATKI